MNGDRSIEELATDLVAADMMGNESVEAFVRGLSLYNEWPRLAQLLAAVGHLVPVMVALAKMIPPSTEVE